MKIKDIAEIVSGFALLGILYFSRELAALEENHDKNSLTQTSSTNVISANMPAPYFSDLGLYNCSGYVRRAAKKLFQKNYSYSDAWNRRYDDVLVCQVSSNEELRILFEKGSLKEGMIIGVYNPKSKYLNHKDKKGKKVKYTHNMLYLGTNSFGKLIFAEQFGERQGKRILEEFTKNNLEAREIIDSKN